jgi:hypothetical protein
LETVFANAISKLNEATGFTEGLAKYINDIARGIDAIGKGGSEKESELVRLQAERLEMLKQEWVIRQNYRNAEARGVPGTDPQQVERRIELQRIRYTRAELEKRLKELNQQALDNAPIQPVDPAASALENGNEKLKALVDEREKIAQELLSINTRMSGGTVDPAARSDAANITAVNRARDQVREMLEKGNVAAALGKIREGMEAIKALEGQPGVSNRYLQTQVELLQALNKQAENVNVSSPVKPVDAAEAVRVAAESYSRLKEAFEQQQTDSGFTVRAGFDLNATVIKFSALQEELRAKGQDPIIQWVKIAVDSSALDDLNVNARPFSQSDPGPVLPDTGDSIDSLQREHLRR